MMHKLQVESRRMWKRLFVYQVSDFRCFEHSACGAEKCKDNCAQVISLISQFPIRIHLSIFFMLRIFSSTVSYMTIERAMLALKVFYAHTNHRKFAKINDNIIGNKEISRISSGGYYYYYYYYYYIILTLS
jgi:hypothetical protein